MATWQIETEPEFDRFFEKLPPYKQAVLQAAIEQVLAVQGKDVCDSEWGAALKGGLFEFRVRRSLKAIIDDSPNDNHRSMLPPGADRPVLLRVFFTVHGSRIVLVLHGYDKGRDASPRRQQREISRSRRLLAAWKRHQREDKS